MISLDVALDFWLAERSAKNRDRLVATYSYLCIRGARKFLRPGLERGDLEQVATIGLLKACDRYDPALQTPFEAYAWLFVVGELMHHVRDFERMVRPPRKLRSLERKLQQSSDGLTIALGREPTDREIAAEMEIDVRIVADLRQCRDRATTDSLESRSAAFDAVEPCPEVDLLLDRLLIESALESLTETERSIILGVYAKGYSQIEIAQRLGYSQRHISRLHKAALEKMLPIWVRG